MLLASFGTAPESTEAEKLRSSILVKIKELQNPLRTFKAQRQIGGASSQKFRAHTHQLDYLSTMANRHLDDQEGFPDVYKFSFRCKSLQKQWKVLGKSLAKLSVYLEKINSRNYSPTKITLHLAEVIRQYEDIQNIIDEEILKLK